MSNAATPSPAKPSPASLPDGLEIFRAGARRARNGTVYHITTADLAASASAYKPDLSEAPLVIGHPEHNKPAHGWVCALHVNGEVLASDHRQVDVAFAESVAAGRIKKRSASFYHPQDPDNPVPGVWYLRHVGFLGAMPPSVKGLADPSFSESDGADTEFGLIHFSEADEAPNPTNEDNDMSKELQDKLDAEARAKAAAEKDAAAAKAEAEALKKQLAEFSEAQTRAQHQANVEFAESQVKAGRLLPKDRDMAVATLDQLRNAEPVEFSEGDTKRAVGHAQWLRDFIAAAPGKVDFSERAGGALPGDGAVPGAAKGKSDADIDKAAKAYAAAHKVEYAEALKAVVGFDD